MNTFRKAYRIQLADGQSWEIKGNNEAQPWLDRFASILELRYGDLNGFNKLTFVRTHSEKEKERLVKTGWMNENHKVIQFWYHPDKTDIICEIGKIRTEQIDYIKMWMVVYIFFKKALVNGGIPLHAGLVIRDRKAYILVARSGTGKTTCCNRIPPPWKSLCDDETLVLHRDSKCYYAHPFPTWSNYIYNRPKSTFNVEQAFPLSGIFFLEQSEIDEVIPIGAGQAAMNLNESATMIYQRNLYHLEGENLGNHKKSVFENACKLAKNVPSYILRISLNGEFWNEIEKFI